MWCESEDVSTEAMTVLTNTNTFYGKRFSGSEICITDAERAALGNIWPGTTFLYASFAELVVMVVGCKALHS